MARKISESQLDKLANEGRLTRIAMRLAIDAGNDWPSLAGEEQDEWHERAIEKLRRGEITAHGY